MTSPKRSFDTRCLRHFCQMLMLMFARPNASSSLRHGRAWFMRRLLKGSIIDPRSSWYSMKAQTREHTNLPNFDRLSKLLASATLGSLWRRRRRRRRRRGRRNAGEKEGRRSEEEGEEGRRRWRRCLLFLTGATVNNRCTVAHCCR